MRSEGVSPRSPKIPCRPAKKRHRKPLWKTCTMLTLRSSIVLGQLYSAGPQPYGLQPTAYSLVCPRKHFSDRH